MSYSQEILSLAQENNGIVTTAMVVDAGISRGCLKYLADNGRLERVTRGVYILPEVWEDEFVNFQSRYKRGIFSLDTALFLCDLTDRTPGKFYMTFPSTYNLSGPKSEGILCNSAKEPLYSLGIELLKTPGGNLVKVYGPERTLCDILRTRNRTDVQIVSEAFKRYTARGNKNIPRLSEYAHMLKVEDKIRAYLEVLL
ncbi:MAG: type IV toxin-antitoxin system AbiEi family antitoxin domain-containing protein [Eubacteriales bacterium]|nr:type IV toxin-antitoxin system AbiEi family antitoxin domain-containing protein [Eubacteriales bacterium]